MLKSIRKYNIILLSILSILILMIFYLPTSEASNQTEFYRFNNSTVGIDSAGRTVILEKVLKSDSPKVINLKGNINIRGRMEVGSNTVINAFGATIISPSGVLMNTARRNNFNSIKNLIVNGGTWKNKSKSGYKKTMIQFSHSRNIILDGMNVTCNIKGHGIELIACKNVKIKNSKITSIGKAPYKCVEEMIQIDIAAPSTAPTIPRNFRNGKTCEDIVIDRCVVSGARGICANYAAKDRSFRKYFHKNITIKNCNIKGLSSEACALFNVMGARVENNVIRTVNKRRDAYSIGLHFATFGAAPSQMLKSKFIILNNKIEGGRQGIFSYSHGGTRFGKFIIKRNNVKSRFGKGNAIIIRHGSAIIKGNKVGGF